MKRLKKLSDTQIAELKALIKDNKRFPCEIKRAQAIISLHNNLTEDLIKDFTGFDKSSVFKLRKKFFKNGISGLATKERKPRALLTKKQRKDIAIILHTKSPKNFNINSSYWTTTILAKFIKNEYGVKYSSRGPLYVIFKEAKFSFHKPGKQYEKHNQEKINEWQKKIKQTLKTFDFNNNAVLLTGDEMILTTQTTFQRVWLPTAKYPAVDISVNRKRRCIYGFLNVFNGQQNAFKTTHCNSKYTCEVLDKIGKIYSKKTIVIIWDNAMWHKSKIMKKYLSDTKYKFHLINFTPYSPETNPQEHVWKAGREKVSHNQLIKDIDKTTNEFIDYLNKTKFNYNFLDLN